MALQFHFRIVPTTGGESITAKIASASELEAWIKSQPDGQLEYKAKRWWPCNKESVPFRLVDGSLICQSKAYFAGTGVTPAEATKHKSKLSAYFCREALRIAMRVNGVYNNVSINENVAEYLREAKA